MDEYVILEVNMPKTSFKNTPLSHYLYIKEHHHHCPTPLANQQKKIPIGPSLFVSNVPIDTTHDHLKYLFNELGGRVHQVFFSFTLHPSYTEENTIDNIAEEKEILENKDTWSVWRRPILRSGSWTIVEFLEKEDVQRILQNASNKKLKYIWGQNIPPNRLPDLGYQHYWDHYHLTYPSHEALQKSIDKYMSAFYSLEEKKKRLRKRQRTEPDEEGFITVARGGRTGAGRINDNLKIQEKKKNKYILHDFYKFQTQEGKKKKITELKKKFKEDREKIQELKEKKRFKVC